MSLTKSLIHFGAVIIHFQRQPSIVVFGSSTAFFVLSPCVSKRIVYFLDSLPRKVVRSSNASLSSRVSGGPYCTTNKKASNPSGASAKILLTSVKIFSWSSRAWLLRATVVHLLTAAVYRTPGVSITEIERSRDLSAWTHSVVTAKPCLWDSNFFSPMIVFPVALFPLPVFPRRTTVRSLPLGS